MSYLPLFIPIYPFYRGSIWHWKTQSSLVTWKEILHIWSSPRCQISHHNTALWLQNSQWYLKPESLTPVFILQTIKYQITNSIKKQCSFQHELQIQCWISSTPSHPYIWGDDMLWRLIHHLCRVWVQIDEHLGKPISFDMSSGNQEGGVSKIQIHGLGREMSSPCLNEAKEKTRCDCHM